MRNGAVPLTSRKLLGKMVMTVEREYQQEQKFVVWEFGVNVEGIGTEEGSCVPRLAPTVSFPQ